MVSYSNAGTGRVFICSLRWRYADHADYAYHTNYAHNADHCDQYNPGDCANNPTRG